MRSVDTTRNPQRARSRTRAARLAIAALVGAVWLPASAIPAAAAWPDAPIDGGGANGVTISVDWGETIYDDTLGYTVHATVDGPATGYRSPYFFRLLVQTPSAAATSVQEGSWGGTMSLTGAIRTPVLERDARINFSVIAINAYGYESFVLYSGVVDLPYLDRPAKVGLVINQWDAGPAGVRWGATVNWQSLAGRVDEVCSDWYSTCRVVLYAVDSAGRRYAMPFYAGGASVTDYWLDRFGAHTQLFTNVGAGILPPRDYTEVFVRITSRAANGVGTQLDSAHVPVGVAPPSSYVALGDSYQSGQGTHDYSGTDTDNGDNKCHRSYRAYPGLLAARGAFGDLDFQFWACSGATTNDLYADAVVEKVPWDDPARSTWYSAPGSGSGEATSALERLGPETRVVTIGTSGNNVDFEGVLKSCVTNSFADTWLNKQTIIAFGFLLPDYSCESHQGQEVSDAIASIYNNEAVRNQLYAITDETEKNAHMYIVGYPHFFPEGSSGGRCQFIRPADQIWMNSSIDQLNTRLAWLADATGATFVDISDVGHGHELCSPEVNGTEEWFMNGIDKQLSFEVAQPESFHPNQLGHSLIADAFLSQANGRFNWAGLISQGQTLTQPITVNYFGEFAVSNSWPGSDIKMSLTSPSGVVYDRDGTQAGFTTDHGATWEYLDLLNPEPGVWTLTLLGVDIALGGEEFKVNWTSTEAPNAAPVAVGTLVQRGATVTVDASGSYDPDGTIVETGIDFGNNATLASSATFTYDEPGPVSVQLWVRDDDGEYGFSQVGTVIQVPEYTFGGFRQLGSTRAAASSAVAGQTLSLGFGLGDDWGAEVMAPDSPSVQQVSCLTGAPIGESGPAPATIRYTPQYASTSGAYSWTWDTDAAWVETCQAVTLAFNDVGTTATRVFDFRTVAAPNDGARPASAGGADPAASGGEVPPATTTPTTAAPTTAAPNAPDEPAPGEAPTAAGPNDPAPGSAWLVIALGGLLALLLVASTGWWFTRPSRRD